MNIRKLAPYKTMKLNKILQKILESCGYSSSQTDTTKKIANKLSDTYSLSELFSYKYYDSDNMIFISDDSYHAVLIELTPLVGISKEIQKGLEHFLNNDLLYGSYLQFLMIASTKIGDNLSFWSSQKKSFNKVTSKIFSEREKFLSNKSTTSNSKDNILPRNFRLFLSCNYKADAAHEVHKFKIFVKSLMQKMKLFGLMPRLCDADNLISLVQEIFEPNSSSSNYNPNILLSEQICTPLSMHQIKEGKIDHIESNLSSKIYFVKEMPREFSLQYMIKLLGNDSSFGDIIRGRFLISYTIANDLNNANQNSIMQKGNRIISSSEEWYSRNNRNILREAAQWREINDRAKNGEKFLTDSFQIMLTCRSEHLDESEQSLLALYQSLDWQLSPNNYFMLPSLLSILPMQSHLTWKDYKYYRLTKILPSKESASKLPIHGEWKGVPMPGMLLLGRRGQIFHWNPFYRISSGNYNICIFGPSGSGKSVFLQELAINLITQNIKVFILDIGRSFKNICTLLGGEIVDFSKASNIALNPFDQFSEDLKGEDRNLAISYAKNIICSMCNCVGDPLSESIIEKNIIESLNLYGSSLDITKFASILSKSEDETTKQLSLSLYSYTKHGLYGKFFSNTSSTHNLKFNRDITVFEFEEIKNNKLLLSVILQIIGMQIFMQFLTGQRDRKFILIVDEAWMILDHSAKFLAEFARTIRKYGGSLAVCVQNYSDLEICDNRRAILQNSTWTILLKQDEKGLSSFKKSEAFQNLVPLISSLSIEQDKYSELLIYSTGIQIVGRLTLDKFSRILYSTDAEIFSEINRLTANGHTLEESIQKIACKKYE